MEHEALKIFSADLATELKAKLQDQATTDFIGTVKASGDDRSFEVVFSTSDEDRQGDALNQEGWDFTYFKMNPVVLFAHDYSSFPVGIATDLQIDGEKSTAKGKFAPAGVNPEADVACSLYQAGILRAVSPGYIQNDDGTRELLEISFCPVPAGRYALSLRQLRSLGVSTQELVTKGFFIETKDATVKADQIGDSCEMEDGTPGVLAEDGDDPGTLVCVPKEEKTAEEKSTETMKQNNETELDTQDEVIEEAAPANEVAAEVATESNDDADVDAKAFGGAVETVDKAGREMSAKNKEKINSIIKALSDHNSAHADSTNIAIASLKELMSSPQEGEGEEQKTVEVAAPKQRSSPPVAADTKAVEVPSDFELVMLSRQILKAVNLASVEGLAQVKKILREKFPDRQ